MVKVLFSTKWGQREIRKLLWIKKHQPVKFAILSFLTDAVIFSFIVFTSLGIAIYATLKGYTTFDSALMGVAVIDLNIFLINAWRFDLVSEDN